MALLLNPRVWAALICAGFLSFSHFTAYKFGKGVVTNAWNAEKLAVATEVRKLEQARTSAVINATAAQTKRERGIVDQSRSASAELQRLRDALASRDSSPQSCPASTHATATDAELLVRSAEALTDLAERCDRHVNDVRTLLEAWPR